MEAEVSAPLGKSLSFRERNIAKRYLPIPRVCAYTRVPRARYRAREPIYKLSAKSLVKCLLVGVRTHQGKESAWTTEQRGREVAGGRGRRKKETVYAVARNLGSAPVTQAFVLSLPSPLILPPLIVSSSFPRDLSLSLRDSSSLCLSLSLSASFFSLFLLLFLLHRTTFPFKSLTVRCPRDQGPC